MIRKPAVAGTFYASDPERLRSTVQNFLRPKPSPDCHGLVVPHAGYDYSGAVAGAGYGLIKNHSHVILLGPSHYSAFVGALQPCADAWETPLGQVKIKKIKGFECNDLVHEPEHCLEVQLPFLQIVLKNFTISPILLGLVDPAALAKQLVKHIGARTLVIASSDLSHYLPYERALQVDAVANQAVPALDFEKAERIQACGKAAILTLMHIAALKGWKGRFVAYDTSAKKGPVVGYGCYAFYG